MIPLNALSTVIDIYHITVGKKRSLGQPYGKLGDKKCDGCCIPGMWISNTGLAAISYITICTNGLNRQCYSHGMNYGQKYHFVIAQTEEGIFKIEKDGKVQEEVKNRNPKDYDNVKAYFSDPWQPGFVGCLSNLKVSK